LKSSLKMSWGSVVVASGHGPHRVVEDGCRPDQVQLATQPGLLLVVEHPPEAVVDAGPTPHGGASCIEELADPPGRPLVGEEAEGAQQGSGPQRYVDPSQAYHAGRPEPLAGGQAHQRVHPAAGDEQVELGVPGGQVRQQPFGVHPLPAEHDPRVLGQHEGDTGGGGAVVLVPTAAQSGQHADGSGGSGRAGGPASRIPPHGAGQSAGETGGQPPDGLEDPHGVRPASPVEQAEGVALAVLAPQQIPQLGSLRLDPLVHHGVGRVADLGSGPASPPEEVLVLPTGSAEVVVEAEPARRHDVGVDQHVAGQTLVQDRVRFVTGLVEEPACTHPCGRFRGEAGADIADHHRGRRPALAVE
jgi:hypothetical protein